MSWFVSKQCFYKKWNSLCECLSTWNPLFCYIFMILVAHNPMFLLSKFLFDCISKYRFYFLFYFVKCPYKMNLDFLYIGWWVFFLITYIITFVWCWYRMYWMESIILAHLHLFNNYMWQVDLLNDDGSSGKCTLLLTGYLRARNLSVNQLVGFQHLAFIWWQSESNHNVCLNLFWIRFIFPVRVIFS